MSSQMHDFRADAPTTIQEGPDRLVLDDLKVSFATDGGQVDAVQGVSLKVFPAEILALVGESGSGKTVTGRSILGLLPETAVARGAIMISGRDVVGLKGQALRDLRGKDVSMIFQEPSSALNPVYPIWWQFGEGLRAHDPKLSKKQVKARAVEALRKVGIPDPEKRVDYYPHEFSGGQKQRIMIAMALEMGAQLIVADEPTTALDVTVQAEILQLLREVRDSYGTSIILITHNMGVVADLADSVAVMYRGRIVERDWATELFRNPQHPYTAAAGRRSPDRSVLGRGRAGRRPSRRHRVGRAGRRGQGAGDHLPRTSRSRPLPCREGRGLHIRPGEVFGLVGESGSGKTTIGRAITGLEPVSGGSLSVLGHQMRGMKERTFKPLRSRLGFVFQDPATSFNPQLTIAECIAEPLVIHRSSGDAAERNRLVTEMLDAVQLPGSYARRYPHELSGGQRQRVSLARALVLGPDLLVADEPTSALDVSVQATVLELFKELQARYGFACLFISHDLAVVDMLAHRIGVLFHGELVEQGPSSQVLANPTDSYTRRLLASLPVPDPVEQAERRAELARISSAR